MSPTVEQITRMRARLVEQMPDVASIERVATTPDASGRVAPPSAHATGVPCRVYPATRRGVSEIEGAGGVRSDVDYEAVVPHDTDVLERDVIVTAGGRFEVRAVNVGQSIQLSKRCMVVRRG